MEDPGQILHQLPEIHPLIRREIKEDLAAVKGALGADQLHIQAVGLDLLHTGLLRPLLLGPVLRHDPLILGGGLAQDPAQRSHHLFFGDGMDAGGADAEFRPPGGIYDHMVPLREGQIPRVKKIDLLPRAELNVHHPDLGLGLFFHDVLLI